MAGSSSKKRLAKNTFYLYALTISSQVISLMTVPYQTRVLSPETYGVVGFMISIMTVASLFVNFGFMYSATRDVAENAEDKREISRIYTAVLIAKSAIGAVIILFLVTAIVVVPFMREHAALAVLYAVAFIVSVMLPDFMYRGLEKMNVITVRTVTIRLASAALIFLFLHQEEDVLVLPLAMLLGNLVALLACMRYDKNKLGIRLMRVDGGYVLETLRSSFPFFVSRAASTVYQSANAIILGACYPGQAVVGWFNAADKVLTVFKYASSPVADSMYPYMIKNKNYKLAVLLLVTTAPFILGACAVLFVFANDVCALFFGEMYREAGGVLRCLIPAMAVIFPTYLICFPILVPMGLSSQANRSNIIGMAIQLGLLCVLLPTGNLNVYTLCISASLSEVSVFLYRLAIMVRYKERLMLQKA